METPVLRFVFVLGLLVLSTGCSSLKEKCEETNWFAHSQETALSGRYLEEDDFIRQCKTIDRTSATQLDLGFKAGRERYCTYETFLRHGEAGETVNFKMCDNLTMSSMQERYAQGLGSFCTAKVGYLYGSSGKVYKNVCLKMSETVFLPAYHQGRREHLTKSAQDLVVDISSMEDLQSQLERQMNAISREITALPSVQDCGFESSYNHTTQKSESHWVCREASYIRSQRSQLYGDMDPLRRQFSTQAAVLQKLKLNLQKAREEMAKLPGESKPIVQSAPKEKNPG